MAFIGLRSAWPPEVEGDGPTTPMMAQPDVVSELFDNIRCLGGFYGEFRCAPGWSIERPASHDAEGFLVASGSTVLTVGEHDVYEVGTGEFALVSPGNAYRMRLSDGGSDSALAHIRYRLDPARMGFLFRLLPRALVLRGFTSAEFRWQQSLAPLIDQQGDRAGPGASAIVRKLLEASLMDVLRMGVRQDAALLRSFGDPMLRRIAPCLSAIHQTPEAPWSVAALARLGGLSRTAFAEAFIERLGESPLRYLTGVRMDLARDLLSVRDLSIAEVAHRTGYGTDVAFARAFRRRFGLSPGRFRSLSRLSQAGREIVGAAAPTS